MSAQSQGSGSGDKRIYVTLAGLPLSFELHWPFHKSTSGADFWVLHADIRLLVARKVYWQTRLAGGPVRVGDPADALYVEASVTHMLEIARSLASEELMTLEGEWASANAALMAQAEKFEADMRIAVAELEKKHAFERG